MAIVWADGFDHYGNGTTGTEGRDFMKQGAWAELSSGNGTPPYIENDNSRTGDCCMRVAFNSLGTDSPKARRVLGASQIVVGCALGIYFHSLPNSNGNWGFQFRNNSNQNIVYVCIQSDGAIAVYTGSGLSLLASSDPVITALSWQHIEAKVIIDNVVGAIEVRVNGLTVINLTDLNLGTSGSTQMVFGMPAGKGGEASKTVDWDDIVVWNDVGANNNDFLGPVRVETLFPTADTAQADWSFSGAASGYECIDENPNDADTTYIASDTAGQVSEFEFADTPPETANIKGIYIPLSGKLVAAGTGNVQVSLVSGVDVSLGPDQTLTTAYTYWGGVHELDPATGEAWTKEAVDAALIRIEKTI